MISIGKLEYLNSSGSEESYKDSDVSIAPVSLEE